MAMTKDQLVAMVSPIVAAVGGMGVAAGYITSNQLGMISSLIVGLISVGFIAYPLITSFTSSSASAQVAKVAALPDVSKVVMTSQAAADAHPATNVVGPAS